MSLGCRAALSLTMALRVVIIFRMTATLLVDRGETVVEDLEAGIISGCAEGSRVEDVTDRHSAAVDAAMSFELATVEVVRRNSDKGSDLLAAHLTELWQESDRVKASVGLTPRIEVSSS